MKRGRNGALICAGVFIAVWLMDSSVVLAQTAGTTSDTPTSSGGLIIFLLLLLSGALLTMLLRTAQKNQQLLEQQAENQTRQAGQERLQQVLNTALHGIASIDEQGRISYFNPAAEHMFGFSAAKSVGMEFRDLLIPLEDEADVDIMQLLRGNDADGVLQLTGLHSDGHQFPLELTIGADRDALSGKALYVIVMRDITHLKQREEELHKAIEATQVASRAKSQFLANMSHELRTPLNAVIGYTEMLLEDAEEDGNEEIMPDLHRIVGSAKHLLGLINDILDISKIEAGRMELFVESFSVDSCVRTVKSTIQGLAEKNGNRLDVFCDENIGRMVGDEQRVRQILFNLLSNACKFTKQGVVSLNVMRDACEDCNHVLFEVRDSGIGMSEEQLARIFDPFTQADGSTTRKYGGTGLGLSIVRQFVDLMGGNISVESTPDEGTCFQVCLPMDCSTGAATQLKDLGVSEEEIRTQLATLETSDNAGVAEDGRPLVLVIEDDLSSLEMIVRALEKDGYAVATAISGEHGLKLLEEIRPVAVVLDIVLPGIDGWTVLRHIKADPELVNIPVVLCTMLDESRRGYVLGASAYVAKPIEREPFLKILRKVTESQSDGELSVMIVEDDVATRDLTTQMLEREGMRVLTAQDGMEGLELLRRSRPDVILLDLMMPNMDGFQFLERIREQAHTRDIPVVVVSSKDLTPEEINFLKGKVSQMLKKHLEPEDSLIERIRETLANSTSKAA